MPGFIESSGLSNSVGASGLTADAPAANTTIATINAPASGVYEITAYAEQKGTAIVADLGNLELRIAGATFSTMVSVAEPLKIRRKLAAADTVLVRTGGGATAAGTRYAGFVTLVRVA